MLRKFLKSLTKSINEPRPFEPLRPKRNRTREVQATVAHKRELTPHTLELGFDGADFDFAPGQHVSLIVPEDPTKGLRREMRDYSIWSHPAEEGPLKTIARITGGRATTWLSQLQIGAPVGIVGPVGGFYLRRPLHRHLVFVATGTGLVPLRSMLFDLVHTGEIDNHTITLLLGVRSQADLFHADELRGWERAHPGFELLITLSDPKPDWDGPTGWVTQHLADRDLPIDDMQLYLCGNGAMVGDALDLFERRGLHRQTGRIACEKFFDRPQSP